MCCYIATASPLDTVWELQAVPFFMASWMQVATDLSADQSLLCNIHCRFCCITIVRVGKGTLTARKPLITLVKSCLPVICYLPLVQPRLFQVWDCAAYCEWLRKDPLLLTPPYYWGCCLPVLSLLVFSWPILENALALSCWRKYAKGLQHVW